MRKKDLPFFTYRDIKKREKKSVQKEGAKREATLIGKINILQVASLFRTRKRGAKCFLMDFRWLVISLYPELMVSCQRCGGQPLQANLSVNRVIYVVKNGMVELAF